MSLTENNTLTPGNWIFDEQPEGWYDYNSKKWANIYVEAEGVESYYVWIPRYVYKLNQETQTSDVKFVDVYNNYTDATTGQVTTYKELIDQGYQLPEAFEWEDENKYSNITSISGYWITKYQLSELEQFNIDYNIAASKSSIVVKNFTNNVSGTATRYTYAINGKIAQESTALEEYVFAELTESEIYIINITALDVNDTIVGSMTKILEPTEVNQPYLEEFDKDTTFYVYWDEDGNEHNEIPISQDPPKEWYNYTYSEWANIVSRNNGIETYLVWIPRYQYKLNQTSQKADIKFILGTGTQTEIGYQIPEAFWWDTNDNGVEDEGEQLTGYWITKYQLSIEESENKIHAELSAGSDKIHVKDIKGTSVVDGLKYEYYINGNKVHEGTDSTENYTYEGLQLDTTYTINIIARNQTTNAYVGAITKKVTTIKANEPVIKGYNDNNTYYVIYDGDTINRYVPITEEQPEGWYDYSLSKWANILVTDGSVSGNTITDETYKNYFVWVPRYEYRILSDRSNESTENRRVDVNFLSGTTTQTSDGYQIPEAFWWDVNDNGKEHEGEQLTGYWITKYQLSN